MMPPNRNWLRAHILLSRLHKHGASLAVISPGSRSTPLAHTALHIAGLDSVVHHDERAAAFFALGAAKASGHPVILICTSGTAAANYYPAIVEAHQSRIPLIVVTADRPEHLQDRGSPQTIRQFGMYAHFAVSDTLPVLSDSDSVRHIIDWIDRCSSNLNSEHGSVIHLNCPFDEPLQPIHENDSDFHHLQTITQRLLNQPTATYNRQDSFDTLDELITRIQTALYPVIVAGPNAFQNTDHKQLFELLNRWKIPVLFDVVSNAHTLSTAVPFSSLLAQVSETIRCDCCIWIGGYPTAKSLANWLKQQSGRVYRVQNHNRVIDPDRIVSKTYRINENELYVRLYDTSLQLDQSVSRRLQERARALFTKSEHIPLEVRAIRKAFQRISEVKSIVLANSLSIRWVDWLVDTTKLNCTFYANKGVNGIDGTLATTAGIARAVGGRTLCIIGDLAFHHDSNALTFLHESETSINVLLLNNGGGGIFDHLPIQHTLQSFDQSVSASHNSFRKIHRTPSIVDFGLLCKAHGIEHHRGVSSLEKLSAQTTNSRVFEVKSESEVSRQAFEHLLDKAKSDAQSNVYLSHKYNYSIGPSDRPTLLFLHGFAGSGMSWDIPSYIRNEFNCVIPDLPGHFTNRIQSTSISQELRSLSNVRADCIIGYSLGARVAMRLLLNRSKHIQSAILVSGNPGLPNPVSRAERWLEDDRLSSEIALNGIEWFIQHWEKLPIFRSRASIDSVQRERMRSIWRTHSPDELASALRLFSVGKQPNFTKRLLTLDIPILWIAGTHDEKYASLLRSLAQRRKEWAFQELPCGHDVPHEASEQFWQTVYEFLNQTIKQ